MLTGYIIYTSHKKLSKILQLYTAEGSNVKQKTQNAMVFLLLRLTLQVGSMVKEDSTFLL